MFKLTRRLDYAILAVSHLASRGGEVPGHGSHAPRTALARNLRARRAGRLGAPDARGVSRGESQGARRPPNLTHAQRETEAEAVAYVVLKALGLPSTAPGYIAWQGGDGQTIHRSMNRIQRAARRILVAVVRTPAL